MSGPEKGFPGEGEMAEDLPPYYELGSEDVTDADSDAQRFPDGHYSGSPDFSPKVLGAD